MIFALFVAYAANVVLRLNDYIPGFRGYPVSEIMIPLLLVLWILFEKKDFSCLTDLLAPAFFVSIVAGYAIAVWPQGALDIAKPMIPWLVLYFLSANLVRTERRLDVMMGVLVATGLVLVAHSMQQVRNYDGVTDATGIGWTGETVLSGRARYVGLMNDPNDLALCLGMIVPLALQMTYPGLDVFSRVSGHLLCLPILLGIFLTNSRGGMLACGMVAALYAYRRFGAIAMAVICGVLIAGALTFGPSRIREQTESDEASTEGRIYAWSRGIELLKQNPVVGIGKDEFTQHHTITAHNSMVLCFAEQGLAGYVVWFGAGFFAMYGLHYSLKHLQPTSRAYRQTAAVFDSLAAFYVGGFFLSRTYFMVLPILLGLAVARFKMTRDERDVAETDEESGEPPMVGFPDLSWQSAFGHAPRMLGFAALSMVAIYVIVRIKT